MKNPFLRPTPEGWSTRPDERMSYYLYFAGQNAIYPLVTIFLTTFLLFQGIDPTKSAAVLLAIKIWDAINDAIFGVVFDSVKFKSGKKFIPWIRMSAFLVPITTVILFAIPSGISETGKLVWLAVGYVLWDAAYTFCDAPIFGVITAMSENLDERNSVLSYKSVWSGVGQAFTYIFATVLVSEKVNGNYLIVAVIVAVFGICTMFSASNKIEERYVYEDEEKFTIKRMFKYLFQNKYLGIYYLGFFFYAGLKIADALTLFVSYYLFNNSMFSLLVQAIGIIPSLIFSLFVPKMIRRFEKMKIYLFCTVVTIVLSIVMWFVGYDSMVWYTILFALRAVPVAIIGVMMFLFTPDCAEYGKYKSGIDAKGITFAIQTFMAKLTAAVAGSLGLFLLGLKSIGWIDVEAKNFGELQQSGVVQSVHALDSLWTFYVIVPAIGCLIAFIVWLTMYKMKDKDVQLMADCNSGKITREEAESRFSRKY